ncbi:MAG: PEP-CTERM sorting domain-containing protein [Deltaproteobacteria bacterium]|nr:PEP-CTERM sorting domain-containing protein [Deltaproteobacteria bacterium]
MLRIAFTFLMSACLLAVHGTAVAASFLPNSPTTLWTPISSPGTVPDTSGDQGTGKDEGDIVGDDDDPAFYVAFDNAGTSSKVDGTLGFRIRLSDDSQSAGFNNFLVIGLDFGGGDIDVFLGVDGQGGTDEILIYQPGGGTNTSPATTSILTPALLSYDFSTSNYDFSSVNNTIDPGVETTDFGNNGTDQFLSFTLPFNDLVTQMGVLGITIDEDTGVGYIVGTGNNPTNLNQDVNGTESGWDDPTAWTDPDNGGGSFVYLVTGERTPEPNTFTLVMLGLIGLSCVRRRGAQPTGSRSTASQ